MSATLFSNEDREQLAAVGISSEEAAWQYDVLRDVPQPAALHRPCVVGDGIVRLDRDRARRCEAIGEEAARGGRVMKFVPASGAATRMFRDLALALEDPSAAPSESVRRLIDHRDEFGFRDELGMMSGDSSWPGHWRDVIQYLLGPDGLGYEVLPKGLVLFHHYSSGARTAFEEQLREGVAYTRGHDRVSRFHFTIASAWRDAFSEELARIRRAIEQEMNCVLDVTFSEQHASTDTLAVDADGNPVRLADGRLLLRPGGHGALLRNLEETRGDIVVVKNIDNIVREQQFEQIVRWKQVLVGHLGDLQREAHTLVRRCGEGGRRDADDASRFAMEHFGRGSIPEDAPDDQARRLAIEALDRPIRVCGVVRNDGEPGGAPFWIVPENGATTPQIVESSQVGLNDPEQARIWRSSTHFNPVDIVCGLRDCNGQSFVLDRFVDRGAVFVSEKSFGGMSLRALERPGLWNGSMAGWNSVFVEVPAETFAPVKTVFDLLRPAHQPK